MAVRAMTLERTHEPRASLEIAVDYVIFREHMIMSWAEFVAKDVAQMLGSAWKL